MRDDMALGLIASIICTVPIRERSRGNRADLVAGRRTYRPGITSAGSAFLALASRFSKLAAAAAVAACNNTVHVELVHKVRVDPRYIKRRVRTNLQDNGGGYQRDLKVTGVIEWFVHFNGNNAPRNAFSFTDFFRPDIHILIIFS